MKVVLKMLMMSFLVVGGIQCVLAAEAIKIGVCLPMSGYQAMYGQLAWEGIQLAQKDRPKVFQKMTLSKRFLNDESWRREIHPKRWEMLQGLKNKTFTRYEDFFLAIKAAVASLFSGLDQGTLLPYVNRTGGVPITLILADTKSDPAQAAQEVARLIKRDKVMAIIGGLTDSDALAIAPIADNAHIPLLSPWAVTPRVNENRPYVFRVTFVDAFYGLKGAEEAHKFRGPLTAAILVDENLDYSRGIANAFREYYTATGGQIVRAESYHTGDSDFTPQLTRIAQDKPAILYVPGFFAEALTIARQARELGLDLPIIMHDAAHVNAWPEIGPSYLEELYVISNFQDRYPHDLRSVTILGWDAYHLLLNAIEKTSTPNGETIREQLQAMHYFQGATGLRPINQTPETVQAAWLTNKCSYLLSLHDQEIMPVFQDALRRGQLADPEEMKRIVTDHATEKTDQFIQALDTCEDVLHKRFQDVIRADASHDLTSMLDQFYNNGILLLQQQEFTMLRHEVRTFIVRWGGFDLKTPPNAYPTDGYLPWEEDWEQTP